MHLIFILWSVSHGETPTFLPFIYFLSPPLVTPLVNPVHCSRDVRYRRHRRPLPTDPTPISGRVQPAHSGWLNVQLSSFFFLFSPPLATAFCLPSSFKCAPATFIVSAETQQKLHCRGTYYTATAFPKRRHRLLHPEQEKSIERKV